MCQKYFWMIEGLISQLFRIPKNQQKDLCIIYIAKHLAGLQSRLVIFGK